MRAFRFAAWVAAPTFFIVLFVVVAALRVSYPFELEWMEGGALAHVERVAAGEPLYVAPSLDFVPYIYTPLYYWVAAGAAAGMGSGFVPLRLISVLSTLGCFGLLVLMGRRESGAWEVGLLAAGLYAATFEVAGAWMDLARVDALFLLLLLGGLYAARWARGAGGLVAAGGLLGLAFLTKQTALVIALPVVAWTLGVHRGLARGACAVAFGLVVGGSALVLDALSDGWYAYYVFTLPKNHEIVPSILVSFWTAGIFRPLGLAFLATVAFFVGARREQRGFYGLLLLGLVGASYASRIHGGGYVNVLLPLYAGLALTGALGARALWEGAGAHAKPTSLLLGLAILVQFGSLLYNPTDYLPTAADRAAGEELVERLRRIEGDVLVVYHPYLAERAGKASQAQEMAMYDVWRGTPEPRARLEAEIHEALRARRFGAVVLDGEPWWGLPEDFEEHYHLAGVAIDDPRAFWPVSGHQTRPERIFLRRD